MHVCLCPFLSLSLCVCRRNRVYLLLLLNTVAWLCNFRLFHVCDILHHFGSSVVPSLFPSFSISNHFFSSVIGVPSSFIAICFRCVVFLTSFYGVLSPPLWFKKKDTSLSCNLNCGFGCTAFSG